MTPGNFLKRFTTRSSGIANPGPDPMKPLRIFIADDHEIIRQGTRAVVEQQANWEVCGVAANGREAVALATELKPDIVVIDMSMPELNGLDAAIQIKRNVPAAEIVILTGH